MKLDKFLIDADALNEEMLISKLEPYLHGIDKNSGIPVFTSDFQNLSSTNKIISILLAFKVSSLLTKRKNEEAQPNEIENLSGIPGNTIRPRLAELKVRKVIDKNERGYFIHNYSIPLIDFKKNSSGSDNTILNINTQKDDELDNQENSTPILPSSGWTFPDIPRENYEKYFEILQQKGFYLERSLLVLLIAKNSGMEGLTPSQIETFLKQKIGGAPLSNKNISYVLGKNRMYIDRVSNTDTGKGFKYSLVKNGEDLAQKFITENSKKQGGMPER